MNGYIEAQSKMCDFLREFGRPARPVDAAAWMKIPVSAARSSLSKLERKGCVSLSFGPSPSPDGRREVAWYSYVHHPEPSKATEKSRAYFREYDKRRPRAKSAGTTARKAA